MGSECRDEAISDGFGEWVVSYKFGGSGMLVSVGFEGCVMVSLGCRAFGGSLWL